MPLSIGFGPFFVFGARVQDRVIRQQLDVSRREIHVEIQALGQSDGFIDVEQFPLARSFWGYVPMALNGTKVVAVVEGL